MGIGGGLIIAARATITKTAAAGRALFARAGFAHRQTAPAEIRAAQGFDRRFGFLGVAHGDEGKPARASAEFIGDEIDGADQAVGGKSGLQIVLGGVEGKISYEYFCSHNDDVLNFRRLPETRLFPTAGFQTITEETSTDDL